MRIEIRGDIIPSTLSDVKINSQYLRVMNYLVDIMLERNLKLNGQ